MKRLLIFALTFGIAGAAFGQLVQKGEPKIGILDIGGGGTAGAGTGLIGADGLCFSWPTRSQICSPADGEIQFLDNAGTSFDGLTFGGAAGSPDSSALLDLVSTTKGLLIPRMDTTARDAITSPATSLLIWNTTTAQYEFWGGAAWAGIGTGTGDVSASASIADNTIVLGDGGAKGIKGSGISVDGSDNVTSIGSVTTTTATGPAILNEAATGTNPTLIPNQADPDSGVAWEAAGRVTLTANGLKAAEARDVDGTRTVLTLSVDDSTPSDGLVYTSSIAAGLDETNDLITWKARESNGTTVWTTDMGGTNTGDEVTATQSVKGIGEIATTAEINAATAGALFLTPDQAATSNILYTNAAKTITADLVNTANPWADNEVSDTLTIGSSGSVDPAAIGTATTTTEGVVELATQSEVNAGLPTGLAITTDTLAATTLFQGARTDYVLVQVKSDLPAPAAGVITLAANTVYDFDDVIALGIDRLVMGSNTVLIGNDLINEGITHSGSGPVITATSSGVIDRLHVDVGGGFGTILDVSGASTDFVINKADFVGTVTTAVGVNVTGPVSSLSVRESTFAGLAEAITVSGSGSSGGLRVTDSRFGIPADTGGDHIDLGTMLFDSVIIASNHLESAISKGSIVGDAASTNLTVEGSGLIVDNSGQAGSKVIWLVGIDDGERYWTIRHNGFFEGEQIIVEPRTEVAASPYVIDIDDSAKWFTNEGATAETHFDLPSASFSVGTILSFYVLDADGMQINAMAGDTIRLGGTVTTAGGFVESSTVGDELILKAVNGTEWVGVFTNGWVDNSGNPAFSAHADDHEDGGVDEISVAGLSGLLADAQTPLAHVLDSATHTVSGQTTGDVLKATSATTFGFEPPLVVELHNEGPGAPYAITADDIGKAFTVDTSVDEVHFDLPTASAGLFYSFIVTDDNEIVSLSPATGDIIRLGDLSVTSASSIEGTTIGDSLILKAVDDTNWIATHYSGGWTDGATGDQIANVHAPTHQVGGTDPLDLSFFPGTLGEGNGGTGQTTYATGDMLYASGVNTLAKLAAGTNGDVLTLAGGVPSWAAAGAPGAHASSHIDGGGDVIDADKVEITWTGHANYTPSTGPTEVDTTDDLTAHLAGIDSALAGATGGTVTSVALSAPAEFTVSGSPVTTSGTLTLTKATQAANTVYSGPSSGGAAAPTFRAIVDDDVPDSITITGLSGTNTGDQTITLTGDVTGSGTGSFAATVAANAITNAKLADVPTATFKGRTTAATGDPEDLSVAQAKSLLNLTGTNSGDEVSATTTTEGIVELATDGESAANVVVQGNDSRLSDSRTPTAHDLTSAAHTDSGLTAGHHLRATSATTFAFGAVLDGDLPASITRDTEISGFGDLSSAETITGNWINTANPWADNEVSDTLTIGSGGSVDAGALPSGVPVATVNTVTTTDNTMTTIATIALADDTVYLIEAKVVARRTDAADRAAYLRNVVAYREGAGSATLQGSVDTPLSRESSGGWDATITVSGNNILIQVDGAVGHTVNWESSYILTEVQ